LNVVRGGSNANVPAWKQAVIIGCSILVALLICAMILIFSGVPAGGLLDEFAASVVDAKSFHAVLVQAAPLILVGVAASIGFPRAILESRTRRSNDMGRHRIDRGVPLSLWS
jgi:ABC-type uncharacterized transport system permease subunit